MWRTLITTLVLAGLPAGASEPPLPIRGLPPTRFYPFEEIGRVTRGNQLTFDAHGRIALVDSGTLAVLNDSSWLNLADDEFYRIRVLATAFAPDGTGYFSALGTWGRIVPTHTGRLRPEPFVPAACPKWVETTSFVTILQTPEAIVFGGWDGIVHWDRSTGIHRFFEVQGVVCLFTMEGEIYVSSHTSGVRRLRVQEGTLDPVEGFGGKVIDHAVPLGAGRMLVSTTGRQILVYERGALTSWSGPLAGSLPGRVTAMQELIDGEIAIAVAGRGLFIADVRGEIHTALTTPEYLRVVHLANNEPGVLWAAADSGIAKVLYGSPVTFVGQAVGLPISWPQVVQWGDHTIIASAGRLYAPAPRTADSASLFSLVPEQPRAGTWAIATAGKALLVGNGSGVYAREEDSSFTEVIPGMDVSRLVMVGPDLCLVIGATEISAMRREGTRWRECTARVPGVGFPSIVHATERAAWIERGGNRAIRIAVDQGAIQIRTYDQFQWPDSSWVHVSVVGSTVILAGAREGRIYIDDETGEVCEAPMLQEGLERAPHWAPRVCEDPSGTLWASHERGIFTMTRKDNAWVYDTRTYDVIDNRVPLIRALPGGAIWVSTGNALYHIDKRGNVSAKREFTPTLVSLRELKTGRELLGANRGLESLGRLAYRQNSLEFTFFAGTYASRRPATYEVRLDTNPWSRLGPSSSLTLADLREGEHALSIRMSDTAGSLPPPAVFRITIAPPWHRAWYAYVTYGVVAGALVFVLVRLSVRQTRARNTALEQIVATRTAELRSAMQRLQQETETSATLAERNRLAGEIHDSLEQGFTGLALQLETTASFPSCPAEVRTGLAVALNMVAFSRSELRHVVRDLHSTMLQSADLDAALRQMLAQLEHGPMHTGLRVDGERFKLGPTVEHHLLRIAQEAVTNAVKHASASRLEIILTFDARECLLVIADNGCGFGPAAVRALGPEHFGLAGMRSRARTIGATLDISSSPGAGTRVSVRVPRPEVENSGPVSIVESVTAFADPATPATRADDQAAEQPGEAPSRRNA